MLPIKKQQPSEKSILHPNNKHRERYNFNELIISCPELATYVHLNAYNDESIDFFNPQAVKMLNKALLKHFYTISYWDIPANYLCPPIPGRADYIHYIAELLSQSMQRKIPKGNNIKCLDIGIGANAVYPIIGNHEYGWSFIGSDIDEIALESAQKIVDMNACLHGQIELRKQLNPKAIFQGILQKDEYIDLCICNPPFHASAADALSGSKRKLSHLKQKKIKTPLLNFSGQQNELWCEGGEVSFINNMVKESRIFASNCFWFSSLVSKISSLANIYHALEIAEAEEVKCIPMGQGNKTSRIVAWTFLKKEQQEKWVNDRWKEQV